jgi:hypothetical protein
MITKHNLLEPILEVVFPMTAEPEDDNITSTDEDSDDEFTITAHKVPKNFITHYLFICYFLTMKMIRLYTH